MDTNSNIRFEDWEAEQMRDPEFRAEVKALEPIYQLEVLRQSILNLGEAIAKTLTPAFQQVIGTINAFVVQLQRTQLAVNLARHWWIPERLACWLSDKWPERWLPELRFNSCEEVT